MLVLRRTSLGVIFCLLSFAYELFVLLGFFLFWFFFYCFNVLQRVLPEMKALVTYSCTFQVTSGSQECTYTGRSPACCNKRNSSGKHPSNIHFCLQAQFEK